MAKLPFQLTNVIAIQQQCSQEGASIDKGKSYSKGEAVEKKMNEDQAAIYKYDSRSEHRKDKSLFEFLAEYSAAWR